MAIYTATGSFNTGTGTSDVTVNFPAGVPKWSQGTWMYILFMWSGNTGTADTIARQTHQRGMGAATIDPGGTIVNKCVTSSSQDAVATSVTNSAFTDTTNVTNAAANNAIYTLTTADAIDGLASVKSRSINGFVMQINDAFAASIEVSYLAVHGEDITRAFLLNYDSITGASNISQTINTVFQPDCLMIFGKHPQNSTANGIDPDSRIGFSVAMRTPSLANSGWCGASNDAAATKVTAKYSNLFDSIIGFNAGVTSLSDVGRVQNYGDSSFSLFNDTNVNASNRRRIVLAIQGGSYSLNKLFTSTGTATQTSNQVGFSPRGLIVLSANASENASGTAVTSEDQWSMGFCDQSANQRCMGCRDQNGLATSRTAVASRHSSVYINISATETNAGELQVTSLRQNDFQYKMTTADAAANFAWFLALGPSPFPAMTIDMGLNQGFI